MKVKVALIVALFLVFASPLRAEEVLVFAYAFPHHEQPAIESRQRGPLAAAGSRRELVRGRPVHPVIRPGVEQSLVFAHA